MDGGCDAMGWWYSCNVVWRGECYDVGGREMCHQWKGIHQMIDDKCILEYIEMNNNSFHHQIDRALLLPTSADSTHEG